MSNLPRAIRLGYGESRRNWKPHMNYLLLIYNNEAETMAMDESAIKKMIGDYTDFTKSIVQAGNFKAGDRLEPVSLASTVRGRNVKAAVTRGPFAEDRDKLSSSYLGEAK